MLAPVVTRDAVVFDHPEGDGRCAAWRTTFRADDTPV